MTERTVVVNVPQKASRWSAWRDVVIVLQTVGLAALLVLFLHGRDDAAADRASASTERQALTSQVAALNRQIATLTVENRKLVALLVESGIDPAKVQAAAPSSSSSFPRDSGGTIIITQPPSTPSNPKPAPKPAPRPTPAPKPTPAPSPTPGCRVPSVLPVGPACLVR